MDALAGFGSLKIDCYLMRSIFKPGDIGNQFSIGEAIPRFDSAHLTSRSFTVSTQEVCGWFSSHESIIWQGDSLQISLFAIAIAFFCSDVPWMFPTPWQNNVFNGSFWPQDHRTGFGTHRLLVPHVLAFENEITPTKTRRRATLSPASQKCALQLS
jgi:hypothetical protein